MHRGVLALPLVLFACSSSSSSGNGTQPGELGRGKFGYICGTNADAQCNSNADLAIVDPATNMPPIALGGTFGVSFTLNNGSVEQITVADTDFINLAPGGTLFQAIQTGEATIYGNNTGENGIVDLVQVDILTVDHLEFAHNMATGGTLKGVVSLPGLMATITLNGGPVTQQFRVVPMTANRKLLAGSLPCTWTSSDSTIAAIMTDATQNIVTVQLSKPGTATLHATLGAAAGDATVVVGM